jgi:hypothetical protein
MTKAQIKKLARLYAANIVYNAVASGPSSALLTDDEHEAFCNQVTDTAHKMLKNIKGGPESLFIGSLDGLIEYVKK